MFDRVVRHYDLLNELLSVGLVRRWRRVAAEALRVPCGASVVDIGCGTGAMAALVAERARVTGIDVSHAMLVRARRTLGPRVRLVQASAEGLPFRTASLDAAISAFVLRNIEHLERAFAELARVLRRGAPVVLLDLGRPPGRVFGTLFDVYFRAAAPALGWLAGDVAAYRYLVGSLEQLPSPDELNAMLRRAGFVRCRFKPMMLGALTLVRAERG